MRIYLSGSCNCGKAEITRKISKDLGLEEVISPSEQIFPPIFGVNLNRVFHGRKWEGKRDETFQGLMSYLDALDREDIVSNEGPLLLLSHLLFFGVLSVFSDEQRVAVLKRCLSLLEKGEHFIVERWSPGNLFDEITVDLQKAFSSGRGNVTLMKREKNFETTVKKGMQKIRKEVTK